ncbi:hypothetical protein M0R45_008536 [Rubus argutus]|uniref:Oligopeptide transporter 4 n=1 Tax=Rubus argutus TaxID=59490 RepID=A0AAW1Y1J3_RUBAR
MATVVQVEAPKPKMEEDDDVSTVEQVRLTVTNNDDPTLPVWTFRMWFLGLLSCAQPVLLLQNRAPHHHPNHCPSRNAPHRSLHGQSPPHHQVPDPRTRVGAPGFPESGPFQHKRARADHHIRFYFRKISFIASWLLIITTQVLGYGWAGLLRKYVVEPAHMWWPNTLVQVSLFRALHEKEEKGDQRISRAKFFLIALICSFSWYAFPGYLFTTLTNISWICWIFSKSVTAQQIGSGMRGLGVGAITLDWTAVASFLFSPLICPFFTIANVFAGYALIVYIVTPIAYWGLNLYGAQKFPIFSSHLFTAQGLFYGREIVDRYRASFQGKEDIHTRLMRKYKDIPSWWFYVLLVIAVAVSLALCIFLNDQVQMPWWGLLLASAMAFIFTLPISIITATTNLTPGLNIITEYIIGIILPGRPIANVCFKTYGYLSMAQAVSFLNDFKLGHYMKIPPRSMFLVQLIGTILAGTVNLLVAEWLLGSIKNICVDDPHSDSPWTCPNDRVFFDASVIWGLAGPKRIFGSLGNYSAINWFFLGGAIGPVFVWLLHRAFPKQTWIRLNASSISQKQWWQRYNYVLSAALDAGVAFMAVLIYLSVGVENTSLTWWGTNGEHCDLAGCPTAKGIVVDGCPVN